MAYPTAVWRSVARRSYAAPSPHTHWLGPLLGPAAVLRSILPHIANAAAEHKLAAVPEINASSNACCQLFTELRSTPADMILASHGHPAHWRDGIHRATSARGAACGRA